MNQDKCCHICPPLHTSLHVLTFLRFEEGKETRLWRRARVDGGWGERSFYQYHKNDPWICAEKQVNRNHCPEYSSLHSLPGLMNQRDKDRTFSHTESRPSFLFVFLSAGFEGWRFIQSPPKVLYNTLGGVLQNYSVRGRNRSSH